MRQAFIDQVQEKIEKTSIKQLKGEEAPLLLVEQVKEEVWLDFQEIMKE